MNIYLNHRRLVASSRPVRSGNRRDERRRRGGAAAVGDHQLHGPGAGLRSDSDRPGTLIVHDDAKMARGVPDVVLPVDPGKGPQERVLFHCTPATRKVVAALTLTKTEPIPGLDIKRVTAYQFAGDGEYYRIRPTQAREDCDDGHR